MSPLVGDFVQPLTNLTIHMSEVAKGSERPEVLTQVADAGTLHFAFGERRQMHRMSTIRTNVSA